jgi:hypothetical protein
LAGPAPGFVPSLALASKVTTDEGVTFSFTNVMAPVFTLLCLVAILTFSLVKHSAVPWLLVLLLPLFWGKSRWTFCYRGPSVKHRLDLFGLTLWRRQWPLRASDSASADLIEDSIFMTARPRWYKLNLWSCAQTKDHELMRSNEPADLERTVALLNDAIKEVCAKAAS